MFRLPLRCSWLILTIPIGSFQKTTTSEIRFRLALLSGLFPHPHKRVPTTTWNKSLMTCSNLRITQQKYKFCYYIMTLLVSTIQEWIMMRCLKQWQWHETFDSQGNILNYKIQIGKRVCENHSRCRIWRNKLPVIFKQGIHGDDIKMSK